MAQSITDVAAFILNRTGTITTMKLHKLAYYAQAAHIVAHGGAPAMAGARPFHTNTTTD